MSTPSQKPAITRGRAGCAACKQQKRRCDLGRPECGLCKRRGRACVYASSKVLAFDGSESQKKGMTLFRPLSLDDVEDPRKLKSFQYFCEQVSPNALQAGPSGGQQMGGFSAWLTQHLRSGRTNEPVLDHLIGALSAVHGASWRLPGPSNSVYYFDCVSKALARLTKGGLGDEAVITSCIILGICEQVRTGDLNANSPYMAIALRILHEWSQQPEHQKSEKRKRLIGGLLPALSVATEANGEARAASTSSNFVPSSFASLEIAENALYDRIIRWLVPRAVQLTSTTNPAHTWINIAPLATVSRIFDAWTLSFRHLEKRHGPTSEQEADNITVLKGQYLTARLMLAVFETPEQTALLPSQHKMAHVIVQSLESVTPATGRVAISGIAPLFFIATRCQQPLLRARALSLLERMDIKEGIWSSRVAWIIAQAAIGLEDEKRGTTASSPASSRSSASRSPPASAASPGGPKGKEKLGTPPPRAGGPLRLESAACVFEKDSKVPTAKLMLKYLITGALGNQQVCTKLIILKDEQDYQACQAAQWPLDAVLKSFGYLRWNALPVPYAASDAIVRDRIITNMMFTDTRALTR